jgi:hypothetical protein
MMQLLLFRDPSPLVDRLGMDFFRQLPECPPFEKTALQADLEFLTESFGS